MKLDIAPPIDDRSKAAWIIIERFKDHLMLPAQVRIKRREARSLGPQHRIRAAIRAR